MEAQIKSAVEHFEKLLREQLKRAESLNENGAKDYKNAKQITIGLIDGDGIGPVIMKEAKKVINHLLKEEIESGKIIIKVIEGLTIENRLAKGQAVPSDTLAEIKTCDVLLKGPTTTPKGTTMESANVALRRELDLYANIRPVTIKEENIDWIFFRENTEGEYTLGSKGIEIENTLAVDFKVTTDKGTKRIAKAAFEYAKANNKDNVIIVTKANIMKKTDGKFSALCHEVAKDYPDIKVDEYYIDIMSANLLNKDIRSNFSVFVLPNLYGDIITDEAAQIQGGVGTAGSANTGDNYAMFEAIHGSAPRLVEDGLAEYANPQSILKALSMLLIHIGLNEKATILETALSKCINAPNPTEKNITASDYCDNLIKTL